MTPVVTVARARPDDVDAMVEVFDETDLFFGAADLEPRDVRPAQITEALFGDRIRVEWTTGRTNLDAQAFYAGLESAETVDKTFYRIDLTG